MKLLHRFPDPFDSSATRTQREMRVVVILHPHQPPEAQVALLSLGGDDIIYIKGHANNPRDLRRAGLMRANLCIITTTMQEYLGP